MFALAITTACGTPGASAPHATSRGQECLREPLRIPPTDISDVYVGEGEGNYGVVVIFASTAAQRILEFSRQNVGNRMAILLDNRMVHIGPVTAPFSENLQMSGLTLEQAERLARRIRSTPREELRR